MFAGRMVAVFLLCGLMLPAGCATRADLDRLKGRLSTLERENQRVTREIEGLTDGMLQQREKDDGLQQMYAGQDALYRQMMEEVRRLNGMCDETDYRVNQALEALRKEVQDLHDRVGHVSDAAMAQEARLKRLEDYMGFEPAKALENGEPDPGPVPGDTPTDQLTEKGMYDAAWQRFDQKDFEAAQEGFEGFLKKYPKSDLADNARFWIGEIYFQEGWYQKAILEYQKVIEGYPGGNKVPAAYYKQGIAFDKLGETGHARLVFKELIEKFPDSHEAGLARKEIKGGD